MVKCDLIWRLNAPGGYFVGHLKMDGNLCIVAGVWDIKVDCFCMGFFAGTELLTV
jgi:hypothetical protein